MKGSGKVILSSKEPNLSKTTSIGANLKIVKGTVKELVNGQMGRSIAELGLMAKDKDKAPGKTKKEKAIRVSGKMEQQWDMGNFIPLNKVFIEEILSLLKSKDKENKFFPMETSTKDNFDQDDPMGWENTSGNAVYFTKVILNSPNEKVEGFFNLQTSLS